MIDREAFHQAMEVFYLGNGTGGVAAATLRAAITAYLTSAGEGDVPVGWQWRSRIKDIMDRGAWDAWENGRAPQGDDRAPWMEYEERTLYAAPHPPRQDGARDGEAEAFRNADEEDWKRLFAMIDDSGHGRFWKAVFNDFRRYRTLYTTPPAPDEAVEAEREACALEALMVGSRIASHQGRAAARLCAKAIRARTAGGPK